MEQISTYTIKLIRYLLTGDVPKLEQNIDFEQLYAFGKSHGVENMLCYALEQLDIEVPADTMKKFKEAKAMAIMVEATQAVELESIEEAFEAAEIDFIPLKGSVIKYLYPMPDYRKSGDIDILIREKDQEKVKQVLIDFGYIYNYIFEEHDVHDSYQKKPYVVLEIHRKLLGENTRSFKFMDKAWDYIEPESGFKHKFSLNIDFLYVYLIAHIAKHLYGGGAGLKLINDIYLIQRNNFLDREKVFCYLKEADLLEINEKLLALIDWWFNDKPCSNREVLILAQYIFNGGSFGTTAQQLSIQANSVENKKEFERNYKVKNIIKDIFEPYSYMKQKYPILIKCKFLLPFMWVVRIVSIPFTDNKKMKDKLNNYKNISVPDNDNLKHLYEIVK